MNRTSRLESVKKAIRPGRNKKLSKIKLQIRNGRNPQLGFLHIPKTGGSGISSLGKKAVERHQPFPCSFPHGWRFAEIRKAFPDMRIAFILRDPLERMISGFNSRLRQGRPTYNKLWSPGEAAAFALFPSVKHYLDALISQDEYHRSACAYAQRQIQHLRWNYSFYFRSPELVRADTGHIALVGRIEETDRFIDALCLEAGFAPDKIAGLYERRHESKVKPDGVLSAYGPGEVAKMRARLAAEYAIYDVLTELAQPARSS